MMSTGPFVLWGGRLLASPLGADLQDWPVGALVLSPDTCIGLVPSWSHPCFPCRTAGTLFGEGFRAFVTDWDKVTATVSTTATSS